MSGGGDSCYGTCDPDECHDKIDCPGNGYWCKDEGIIHVIKSIRYEFNYNIFHNDMQLKYLSIVFLETNFVPPDDQGNLTPRKIIHILSWKL